MDADVQCRGTFTQNTTAAPLRSEAHYFQWLAPRRLLTALNKLRPVCVCEALNRTLGIHVQPRRVHVSATDRLRLLLRLTTSMSGLQGHKCVLCIFTLEGVSWWTCRDLPPNPAVPPQLDRASLYISAPFWFYGLQMCCLGSLRLFSSESFLAAAGSCLDWKSLKTSSVHFQRTRS